ncbi:hypothetical protein TRICI_003244 [Trichomonascus ciferrii]|uniref:Transcription factor TFIIIC triple barrel domain-containing protein n=1 Tax=Trichomonascus ciferrii TaxID=44093 RepID=A0A642V4G5_9ASCO|nr:hypothetical protein TRICI_003244 [Trichomonascus ciferrii]
MLTTVHSNIPAQAALQIVDLHKDRPLFKVGDGIFEGRWEDMVGTDIFTDLDGHVFAKTRTRIQLRPGQLLDKSEPVGNDPSSLWTKKTDKTLVDRLREISLRRKQEELDQEEEEEDDDDESDDNNNDNASRRASRDQDHETADPDGDSQMSNNQN